MVSVPLVEYSIHPTPNLYKEPRNQKFLAPLFFSCESSGESDSLSFCLALAAFSDPGAGRGGRPPRPAGGGRGRVAHHQPRPSPGTVEAARAKQKDRLTVSPLLSQLNEICGKAIRGSVRLKARIFLNCQQNSLHPNDAC